MGRGTDASCMHRYLEKIEGDGIQTPQEINMEEFLPAGAPLLDFLAAIVDRLESWKYPPGGGDKVLSEGQKPKLQSTR